MLRVKHSFLFVFLLVAACGEGPDLDEQSQSILDEITEEITGTIDEPLYTPPADGKVTVEQIKMYVAIRKLESEMMGSSKQDIQKAMQEMKKYGDKYNNDDMSIFEAYRGLDDYVDASEVVGDFMSLDLKAAKKLGHNVEEYEWVRDTLMEAETYRLTNADVMGMAYKGQVDALAQLKEARAKENNPDIIKALDESILDAENSLREIDAERKANAQENEALRHNAKLLESYGNEINIMEAEMKKFEMLNSAEARQ